MIDIKVDPEMPVCVIWTPEVAGIARAVDLALHPHGLHARITSGTEGHHGKHSLHARAAALDFSIAGWGDDTKVIVVDVRANLDKRFNVVLESDHLHVEFDPKESQGRWYD